MGRSSSLQYLSASSLHQGLCYRVEVWFAAKQSMKKHQGSALTLSVKDIIGQADWTVGGTGNTEKLIIYLYSFVFCFVFFQTVSDHHHHTIALAKHNIFSMNLHCNRTAKHNCADVCFRWPILSSDQNISAVCCDVGCDWLTVPEDKRLAWRLTWRFTKKFISGIDWLIDWLVYSLYSVHLCRLCKYFLLRW